MSAARIQVQLLPAKRSTKEYPYRLTTGKYSALFKLVSGNVKRYHCRDFGCSIDQVKPGNIFEGEIKGKMTLVNMMPLNQKCGKSNTLSNKTFKHMNKVQALIETEQWKVKEKVKRKNKASYGSNNNQETQTFFQ